ncbi:MAG TPA: DegT/DnrJ/EryC1/StrS aminotransferase family protein [Candidatus Binatia bacterium]|nr:DegT/DnrJ/EryC1/StrS aminotransferase family protein [Candidatus Binatia bacterium]
MEGPIPFHRPSIGEEEIAAVVATLRSGWLTTGERASTLERVFADAIGVPHALAVSSGTAALHLALRAAGIGAGDEVIVPTTTFTATAEAVVYLGARPVLADVDPVTGNVGADEVARRVGRRTRAVVPVHLGGLPCDLDAIGAVARQAGIVVIDDAAHALPARVRGRPVGTLADATAFSFYATKNITTGEGGVVTTARADWAERMQLWRLHGLSRDAWKRYTAEGSWAYEVVDVGFKYNLPDVLAAIGLAQLPKLDRFLAERRALAARYHEALAGCELLALPEEPPELESAWHLYVVRLALERLRMERAAVIEALREHGIGTSVHFIPLHRHPYYRRTLEVEPRQFPGAEALFAGCISLPLYPGLAPEDVDRVASTLLDVLRDHRR